MRRRVRYIFRTLQGGQPHELRGLPNCLPGDANLHLNVTSLTGRDDKAVGLVSLIRSPPVSRLACGTRVLVYFF